MLPGSALTIWNNKSGMGSRRRLLVGSAKPGTRLDTAVAGEMCDGVDAKMG